MCEHLFVLRSGPPAETACILHADLDAFYASVHQRDDPGLRGRPVIVGGGVVLAASYEAKAYGIRTAMGGHQARRLCPQAVVVRPDMSAYTTASRAVFDVFRTTTPLVEGLSIDEAFLDVGGLRRLVGPPVTIAEQLRARVRDEVGLPITVGVARTKFLAKVASGVAKPDGLLEVPRTGSWPSSTRCRSPGCGASGRSRPRSCTTGASPPWPTWPAWASRPWSPSSAPAPGATSTPSPRAATPGGSPPDDAADRSGRSTPWAARRRSPAEVDEVLIAIVERVTRRLRSARRVGRTVVVRLRFDDYGRATRSHTLPEPTASTSRVLEVGPRAPRRRRPPDRGAGPHPARPRRVGPGRRPAAAAGPPLRPRDDGELDAALDLLRDRYGSGSVTRATLLGRDHGPTVPLLPD